MGETINNIRADWNGGAYRLHDSGHEIYHVETPTAPGGYLDGWTNQRELIQPGWYTEWRGMEFVFQTKEDAVAFLQDVDQKVKGIENEVFRLFADKYNKAAWLNQHYDLPLARSLYMAHELAAQREKQMEKRVADEARTNGTLVTYQEEKGWWEDDD